MKLFTTALKNFAVMGIGSNQSPINGKMMIATFFLWLTSIFNTIFLVSEANNFKDYTQNLYMTVASTLVAICYVQIVSQKSILLKFIDGFEINIDESE